MSAKPRTAPVKIAMNSAYFVIALFVAFAAMEGLAGALFFGVDLTRSIFSEAGLESQRLYLEPDTLTGWRPIPNHESRDLWGPGRDFITNEQGFRHTRPISTEVATGTIRIVCSGDSYTMGLGVSNTDTWCARMERSAHLIETANLGASGFGIDQAYLRYTRDGVGIEHQIHIFAMIADDFRRMTLKQFVGYEKPLFQLAGDSLIITNVPVPETSKLRVWMTWSGGELVNSLHLSRAGARVLYTLGRRPSHGTAPPGQSEIIASKILQKTIDASLGRGATPVLVYLPIYAQTARGRDWIALVDSVAGVSGIPFVDVATPAFLERQATRTAWFRAGDGHYTEAGNEFVAGLIAPVIDSIIASRTVAGN